MNEQELKAQYLNLVNDIRFDKLELMREDQSIFEIIGAAKAEVRHSNFLAWLLDPDASHGLNESILKRFLRELLSDVRAQGISEIEVEQFDYGNVRILREWNNIDLLIEFEDLVIALENKILSREHSDQLARYFSIVQKEFPNKRRAYGFLTPEGYDAENESKIYISISYRQVVEIIERVMEVRGESLGINIQVYINDYVKTLRRQVMETDKSIDLAIEIYKSHKDLIDFIIDHKPDHREPVIELFKRKILSRGYIIGSPNKRYLRFASKGICELLPPYMSQSGGWTNKEPFQYEFSFWSDKYISFIACVSPAGISEELRDIILQVEGAEKPSGSKWFTFFNTKMSINYDRIADMKDEELNEKIDQFMNKIEQIITKVDAMLLSQKSLIPEYLKS